MSKAISFSIGIDDAEIWIEYNPNNNNIQQVQWDIPAGIVVRARVWDLTRPESEQLVLDRTEGQGSGAINIPGNYRMVEVTEDGQTFMDLPPNIQYTFNMQTIG
jgi:hypothetical protein